VLLVIWSSLISQDSIRHGCTLSVAMYAILLLTDSLTQILLPKGPTERMCVTAILQMFS